MPDPLIWFEKGVNLFEIKNYSGAIAAFDQAIKINPALSEAWNNRGLCLIHTGQYREAILSFDRTLALNPGHENAKKGRSIAVDLLGRGTGTAAAPAGQAGTAPAVRPVLRNATPVLATGPARNPWLAGIFSLILPGWGQWYNGRRWDGLKFFGMSIIISVVGFFIFGNFIGRISYYILLLGIAAYSMLDAYRTAKTINRGELPFARKSRLFWIPAVVIILPVITVILGLLAAVFFWIAATSGGPHTPVIAATAQQTAADTIMIQYHGGQDARIVTQLTAIVTDSGGKSQVKTLRPSGEDPWVDIPGSIPVTGDFSGKDHVVVVADTNDGSKTVIYDDYL